MRDLTVPASRRTFLKATGAAVAASCLPVNLVELAFAEQSRNFTFAYISDAHIQQIQGARFVRNWDRGLIRAVAETNLLDPKPDFVVFGGDLGQLGKPAELDHGAEMLAKLKYKTHYVMGEHDYYLDLGKYWTKLFGPQHYSFDHKGVHFVVLNSVVEKDFWTAPGYTPAERMDIVAGLDDSRQSRFEVGEPQRDWLKKDLAKVPKNTPIIVFSHSPLYKYYRPWNFWTEDAEQVQAILKPFKEVTVIHGHTHQVLTNKIGNIQFHGLLSTAWPWPYAPEGLPIYTVQQNRSDPFNQFDGCGDGTVAVLKSGWVNNYYNLWDRNPYVVTAQELATDKIPGARGYKGPAY